ncbi:MAG: hypothetical protein RL266_2235 [Bacteroidota bacterium]
MLRLLYISISLLFLMPFHAEAQELQVQKSDSVAKIEGELYSIHVVQAKQTLFSIAKAYEVKLSRIAFDNPGVLDGLKLGQSLKILKSAQGETIESELVKDPLELDGEYVLYTVPKQQTLYAISKEYNTSISSILDANPELADGLKVGSTIRIPVPKMLGAQHTEKVEMVGLPDIVKRDNSGSVAQKEHKASAKGVIALLLPLYLTENDTLSARKLLEEPEEIYERSEIGLAFYEGFLLAVDSLNKLGYDMQIKVFDTENRPWKVQQLVKQGKLNGVDLIIGPLYGKVFAEVEKFAHTNCIPLVSPTLKGNEIVDKNDYVLKLVPSDETMVYAIGRYVSQSDSTKNLVLHYGAADEQRLLWRFRQGLEADGMKPANFPAVNMNRSSRDSLRTVLSRKTRNNLIILSNNEARLASLLRTMTNWTEESYIVGFAPNAWQTFKNVEMDYFDHFRLHIPTPFFVDYERIDVQLFVQRFRNTFKTDPSTFAFRGYDLAMHLIPNLNGIMESGPSYLESVQESGLQSDFRWIRVPNGGLENAAPRMVDYTGYELKLATD